MRLSYAEHSAALPRQPCSARPTLISLLRTTEPRDARAAVRHGIASVQRCRLGLPHPSRCAPRRHRFDQPTEWSSGWRNARHDPYGRLAGSLRRSAAESANNDNHERHRHNVASPTIGLRRRSSVTRREPRSAGSPWPMQTCLCCRTSISSTTPRDPLGADRAPQRPPGARSAQRRRRRSRLPRFGLRPSLDSTRDGMRRSRTQGVVHRPVEVKRQSRCREMRCLPTSAGRLGLCWSLAGTLRLAPHS